VYSAETDGKHKGRKRVDVKDRKPRDSVYTRWKNGDIKAANIKVLYTAKYTTTECKGHPVTGILYFRLSLPRKLLLLMALKHFSWEVSLESLFYPSFLESSYEFSLEFNKNPRKH
jgi:hypothetical protein